MHLFQRYQKHLAKMLVAALFWGTAPAQNNNVTLIGRVIDERTKDPLPGAVVHILGTTHQVVADNNGEFTFLTGQRVPATYEVTFAGYKRKAAQISSYGHVDIQLEEANKALGDVLIVGYGTQRRSDLTGSVATVS